MCSSFITFVLKNLHNYDGAIHIESWEWGLGVFFRQRRALAVDTQKAQDVPSPPTEVRLARIGIVAQSTALCTPLFPIIGIANLTTRLRLKRQHALSRSITNAFFGSALPIYSQILPLFFSFCSHKWSCGGFGVWLIGCHFWKSIENPTFPNSLWRWR